MRYSLPHLHLEPGTPLVSFSHIQPRNNMAKTRDSKKQTKKAPLKSKKEKKQAKREKKGR
jgi:hypothetical protein